METQIGEKATAPEERLWEEYKLHIELYKFHVDVVVRVNVFLFAGTGAILSYYLAGGSLSNVEPSLWLPVVLSSGLALIFTLGAYFHYVSRRQTKALEKRLELATTFEDLHLVIGLVISGMLHAGTAVVLFATYLR